MLVLILRKACSNLEETEWNYEEKARDSRRHPLFRYSQAYTKPGSSVLSANNRVVIRFSRIRSLLGTASLPICLHVLISDSQVHPVGRGMTFKIYVDYLLVPISNPRVHIVEEGERAYKSG